jgi:transposase
MFLKKNSTKNGRIFLTLVHGYRKDGKVKQKHIENFGYLDELEKKFDDPIAHFKEVAKQRTKEYNSENKINIVISNNRKIADKELKNLGCFAINNLYKELSIDTLLNKKQRQLNSEFSLNDIFKLLIYNRIICPSSKKEAFEKKGMFFEQFNFELHDIYRSLKHFNNYKEDIVTQLDKIVTDKYGRKKDLGYYDVTNYYFEITNNDEDALDENGNIIKAGFRKKGFSKEHRPDPLVQMGLLMDDNGIPITFNTFPGNQSEKTSLLPTIKQVKRNHGIERIVVVADRGLNTSDNAFFLAGFADDSRTKDGYIFGQSVLGGDKEFKAWVLDQEGYIDDIEQDKDDNAINFRHKSRIIAKTVTIKRDGKRKNKVNTYQKQLVYFSKKYATKQKNDRDKVIAKATDLINNPGKYNKATSHGASAYVNNLAFVKGTGEIANAKNLSLNLEKIKEQEAYDGYYSIVTSEKKLSDKQIRDIYKGLWEIEESFKIIKSEFKARPVFLQRQDHIEAHFLICFVALVIFRLLEIKLDKKFTVKEIRNALININCTYLDQNIYAIIDRISDCSKELCKVYNVNLDDKYIKLQKIKKILQIR